MSKPRLAVETRQVPPFAAPLSATVGIDLASRAPLTAAARIGWSVGGGRLTFLESDLDDAALVTLARGEGVRKVAIDAPFGWPEAFADAVSSYTLRGRWRPPAASLVYRVTDEYVRTETKQIPLSVSADRIAHTAFRCARLLTTLAAPATVDRSGDGLAVEVYPAAALRRLGLALRRRRRPRSTSRSRGAVRAPTWFRLRRKLVRLRWERWADAARGDGLARTEKRGGRCAILAVRGAP